MKFVYLNISLLLTPILAFTGCTGVNLSAITTPSTVIASPSTTTTAVPAGARAAKIIFQQSSGGSFNAPPASGTPATPGSGLQAIRVFNADGSLLATGGPSSSNWPQWLSSFEIGISGPSNASSKNSYCANFANFDVSTPTEDSLTNCQAGSLSSPTAIKCGATSGQFRVSEVDCTLGSPVTLVGNGGPSDGVYMRATFNRDTTYLGSAENILVVLEYAAAAVHPAPADPTACFTSGSFTPESCVDFVWKAFIKHSSSEIVQPYLLLIPPTFTSILTATSSNPPMSGAGIASKQFFIPLAGDQNLTILQISRIQSNFPGNSGTSGTAAYNLLNYCTSAGTLPGKSPLCAGVIFYSITFFRI